MRNKNVYSIFYLIFIVVSKWIISVRLWSSPWTKMIRWLAKSTIRTFTVTLNTRLREYKKKNAKTILIAVNDIFFIFLPNAKSPKYRFFETWVHLMKASLGTGILAMPNAFKNAGYLIGSIGTFLVGFLCTFCMHLLVREHNNSSSYANRLLPAITINSFAYRPARRTGCVSRKKCRACHTRTQCWQLSKKDPTLPRNLLRAPGRTTSGHRLSK